MKRILILYFSGVGNTLQIARRMAAALPAGVADLRSVEGWENPSFAAFDGVILGTPTYHGSPARPVVDFLEGLPPLERPLPVFLYATCGLYPANTLHTLGRLANRKNLCPVRSSSYRCSATDGILLAPFVPCWFSNERGLGERLSRDARGFLRMVEGGWRREMPPLRLHGLLNLPNQWAGEGLLMPIHLHEKSCVRCGKCAGECPMSAFTMTAGEGPTWNGERCIHCYRCIHHCPGRALSLLKGSRPVRRWRPSILG